MSHTLRDMLFLLGILVALRAGLLSVPSITDPTESRYAMIGENMAESNDYVTPRLWLKGELVPYMGKPPLHFWLTALSFEAFGPTTGAARLPSLVCGLITIALTGLLGVKLWGAGAGATAALIVASAGLFIAYLGGCVIDMTLTAAVTGAMVSFALEVRKRSVWAELGFFFSLAAGFLTKGPVALLTVLFPIAVWAVLTKRWKDVGRLPWVAGTILFLVLTVPWFLMAEAATPGFLRYFFVNENFLRFVSRHYGDLYGAGHRYPYGTIWIALAIFFLPWTLRLVRGLWYGRRQVPHDRWIIYALCWGLTPAVVFTFGRQWLPAYLLPGFPGLALVTAVLCAAPKPGARKLPKSARAPIVEVVLVALALAIIPISVSVSDRISDRVSTKTVLDGITYNPELMTGEVVFYRNVPDSALFYGPRHGLRVSPIPVGDEIMRDPPRPGRVVVFRFRKFGVPPEASGLHEVFRTSEWAVFR